MLTLLDFYADWCGPCKIMAPVIDEIAKEFAGKIIVKKINIDTNSDLAEQYNVMSFPTLIILKDDKPVKQLVGYQGKENIISALQPFLTV